MTPILLAIWITNVVVTLIAGIMIYKVLEDCRKRAERRQRQQEARYGRRDTTGSSAPG